MKIYPKQFWQQTSRKLDKNSTDSELCRGVNTVFLWM